MARTRRQSSPANSASNWAWFIAINPSFTAGQVKRMLLQPLVGHHQTGAVPIEQFQPIRLPGAEHEDRPRERILAQLVLHQRARLSWPLRKSMGFVATMIRTRFDGKITAACRQGAHDRRNPLRRGAGFQPDHHRTHDDLRPGPRAHRQHVAHRQRGRPSARQTPPDPQAPAAPAAPSAPASATTTHGSPEHHAAAPPRSRSHPASASPPRSGPSPHPATSGSGGRDRQPGEPPM
jgi:hypothetical protein